MSRRMAREDTFKIIFQSLINILETDEYLKDYFLALEEHEKDGLYLNKPVGNDNEYVRKTVEGVLEKREVLDRIIAENLVDWSFERISKVCVAAMRLALYEIMYKDDIPISVAINEAIDIAKKYDGPESASFVNGALAAAVKKIQPGGEA